MSTIPHPLFSEVTRLHAEICSALADPTRILLLYALSEKPYMVNDLAEYLGITQPNASRHLKTLRDHGMARALRRGSGVEYSLTDPRLIQVLDLLREVLRDRIADQASLIEITQNE